MILPNRFHLIERKDIISLLCAFAASHFSQSIFPIIVDRGNYSEELRWHTLFPANKIQLVRYYHSYRAVGPISNTTPVRTTPKSPAISLGLTDRWGGGKPTGALLAALKVYITDDGRGGRPELPQIPSCIAAG